MRTVEYILIRRESEETDVFRHFRPISLLLLRDPASEENVVLEPRDTIYVFNLEFGRQRIVQPILDELELQSQYGKPYREVSVTGQVKAPGSVSAGGGYASQRSDSGRRQPLRAGIRSECRVGAL